MRERYKLHSSNKLSTYLSKEVITKYDCIPLYFYVSTDKCFLKLPGLIEQQQTIVHSYLLISNTRLPIHRQRYIDGLVHRPYSRQVTEWMECDVAKHTPPSVYPKASNGALRDQWAMKYHCQNESPTIVLTVRDLVHWNYVTSENIPCVRNSWKSLLSYVFATYIVLFIRHSLHCNWLPVNSGVAANIGPLMN